jgi:hypothetical protein
MVKNTPQMSFSVPDKQMTQFENENNAERKQLFGKCCKRCQFSTALNGFILHRTFFAYHNICVIFFTEFFLCSIFFIVLSLRTAVHGHEKSACSMPVFTAYQ